MLISYWYIIKAHSSSAWGHSAQGKDESQVALGLQLWGEGPFQLELAHQIILGLCTGGRRGGHFHYLILEKHYKHVAQRVPITSQFTQENKPGAVRVYIHTPCSSIYKSVIFPTAVEMICHHHTSIQRVYEVGRHSPNLDEGSYKTGRWESLHRCGLGPSLTPDMTILLEPNDRWWKVSTVA